MFYEDFGILDWFMFYMTTFGVGAAFGLGYRLSERKGGK